MFRNTPKGCKIQSSNPENFDYDFTTNEGCELHHFAVFSKSALKM